MSERMLVISKAWAEKCTQTFHPHASQVALVVKNPPAMARGTRDVGSIPGSGRSPGEGKVNPLQYSCLEHPHGQRSLVDCSPQGHKESDRPEHTHTHTHTDIILNHTA